MNVLIPANAKYVFEILIKVATFDLIPVDTIIDRITVVFKSTDEFEMPENLTLDCEDLIHKMLNIDADTRITIAEIREHRLMHGPRKEIEICIQEL